MCSITVRCSIIICAESIVQNAYRAKRQILPKYPIIHWQLEIDGAPLLTPSNFDVQLPLALPLSSQSYRAFNLCNCAAQKLVASYRRRSVRGAEASAMILTKTSARTSSSTTKVTCSLINHSRKLIYAMSSVQFMQDTYMQLNLVQ